MADSDKPKYLPNMDLVSEDGNSYTFRTKNRDGDPTDTTASKAGVPSVYNLLKLDKGEDDHLQPTASATPIPPAPPTPPQYAAGVDTGNLGSQGPAPMPAPDVPNTGGGGPPITPAAPAPTATGTGTGTAAVEPGATPPAAATNMGAAANAPDAPFSPSLYNLKGASDSTTTTTPNDNVALAGARASDAIGRMPGDTRKAMSAEAEQNLAETQKRVDISTAAYDQQKQRAADAADDYNDKMGQYKSLLDQRQGMSIDQNRIFGEGETGNKIWAALALALGGLGQAFTGKDYNATIMGIINKTIDRDIDVQKMNLNAVDAQLQNRRGMLEDALRVNGDMRAATEATRLAGYQWAKDQIDKVRYSPQFQDAQIQANLDKIVAQFNTEYMKGATVLGQTTFNKANSGQQHLTPTPDNAYLDKYLNNAENMVALDHIEKLLPDYLKATSSGKKTNWFHEQYETYAKKYGLQGENEDAIYRAYTNMVNAELKAEGNSRAFTPGERPELEKAVSLDLKQPEATIRSQIAQRRAALIDSNRGLDATMRGANKQPLNWQQIYKKAGGGQPWPPKPKADADFGVK